MLLDFAKKELDLLGMTEDNTDIMDSSMREHILKMVEVFADEGHSGFSASFAINCLEKILKFQPISPLTGDDSEWTKIEFGPEMEYQNKRCPRIFKTEDGVAYDAEGIIFWELVPDEEGKMQKSYFTNKNSRVNITFPYVPEHRYLERTSCQ